MDEYITEIFAANYSIQLTLQKGWSEYNVFYEVVEEDELVRDELCTYYQISKSSKMLMWIDTLVRSATPAIFKGCVHDVFVSIVRNTSAGSCRTAIHDNSSEVAKQEWVDTLPGIAAEFGFTVIKREHYTMYNLKLAANPNAPRIMFKNTDVRLLGDKKYVPKYPPRISTVSKIWPREI